MTGQSRLPTILRGPLLALILGSALGVSGCRGQPTGQVTGVVTHKGQPVAGAEMRFVATGNEDEVYSGVSRPQGKYQVSYRELDGLPVGRYKVTITVYMIPGDVPFPPGERAESLKAEGKLIESAFVFEKDIVAGANTIDFELISGQKVQPHG